jgi:methionine-rich copper-binding protein CopC
MTPRSLTAPLDASRPLTSRPLASRIAMLAAAVLFATASYASPVVASPLATAANPAQRAADLRASALRGNSAVLVSAWRRHLKLVKSSPAADSVLATAPTAIRLWLSEPAELPATKIALTTAAGATVKLNAVTRAASKDAPLEATIATPLANGVYKVTWKAMSKDGHVVNGTFTFTVGAK